MNEVFTIEPFRADTTLYFAPDNTNAGRVQGRCSKSTPSESEAEALAARGLSGRNPAH